MDLITHALLSRILVGREAAIIAAGVAPDLPFYLTYPPWVIARGEAAQSLVSGDWPDAPPWMEALHYAAHSVPVALLGSVLVRALTRHWPRRELAAWLLHIVVDVPTHSRQFWGPQFLWPLSDYAVDGVPWAEISARALAEVLRRLL